VEEGDWIELYKSAELAARYIENIRLYIPEKHPKTVIETTQDGKIRSRYILDWYRSQRKYLNSRIVDYLVNLNLSVLQLRGVNFHYIPKTKYNENKKLVAKFPEGVLSR